MLAALLLLQTQLTIPAEKVQELLSRLTEEAEMLRQNAPKAIAVETLEQRALRPPSRFRPAPGAGPADAPRGQVFTREIVSEYSVGVLKQTGSDNLMEFRQVVAVDGQPVQSHETARRALAMGLRSAEDRVRKQMLEDFERHGLVGAVSDFGILLLQFTKRGIRDLKLTPYALTHVGSEQALVFNYEQVSGDTGLLELTKRRATRYPLNGRVFVRFSDGVPLRISCSIERKDGKKDVLDQATVEYVLSSHGFYAPASVVHRQYINRQLVLENQFRYAPFRTFGADTEIKFTEIPEPPKP
jgi:hypothetical protein